MMSGRIFAQVVKQILGALPNAADPERVFSELGRMITPTRTSLGDCQSSRMLHIAADYRVKQREVLGGASTTLRNIKKFSTRAEAILRLRSIGNNSVVVVSHVPHGAVVEVQPPCGERARRAHGGSGSR
jgi:hypothetical protein